MWHKLGDWFSGKKESEPGRGPSARPEEPRFVWYDAGPPNPFGVRILDVRPLTQELVATTSDPKIAERHLELRHSDGRYLVGKSVENGVRIPVSFRFPHNGAALEGIAFKADSMDLKWDIYVYDSVFLFARSWTGDLIYRAFARVNPDSIEIHEIEAPTSQRDIAASHVYFLMVSHAMGRPLPHQLPADPPLDNERMAVMSFSLFGRLALYATFEDVTRIPIPPASTAESPSRDQPP